MSSALLASVDSPVLAIVDVDSSEPPSRALAVQRRPKSAPVVSEPAYFGKFGFDLVHAWRTRSPQSLGFMCVLILAMILYAPRLVARMIAKVSVGAVSNTVGLAADIASEFSGEILGTSLSSPVIPYDYGSGLYETFWIAVGLLLRKVIV